jgi:hypothetical protein
MIYILELLVQKGLFPYEYLDSFERLMKQNILHSNYFMIRLKKKIYMKKIIKEGILDLIFIYLYFFELLN